MSQETLIPRQYVPAIVAGAIFFSKRYDPRVPEVEKRRLGLAYTQEVRRASMSEMPSLEEMTLAIFEGYRQGIHRGI